MLAEHLHSLIQLFLRNHIRTGQNDGCCCFDLVVIELAEVLHIDFHFACIHNGNGAIEFHFVIGHLLHCCNNVRQFANTGRLNHDPVRVILGDHLR